MECQSQQDSENQAGDASALPSGQPDSGGCQFFITVGPMPVWNGKYTIFGLVVEGQDVVDKINRAPAHGDKPVAPVKLVSVTIERHGPDPKGKKK